MGWLGEQAGESRLWVIETIPAAGFLTIGMVGAVWLFCAGRQATDRACKDEPQSG